jgi:hypothetical protein
MRLTEGNDGTGGWLREEIRKGVTYRYSPASDRGEPQGWLTEGEQSSRRISSWAWWRFVQLPKVTVKRRS